MESPEEESVWRTVAVAVGVAVGLVLTGVLLAWCVIINRCTQHQRMRHESSRPLGKGIIILIITINGGALE